MDDCISREAAIEAVCRRCHYEFPEAEPCGDCPAKAAITAVPAADVEPVRHGRWGNYELRPDGYRCSYCKNTFRTCQRFCPNCGAEMDLEDKKWQLNKQSKS